MPHPDRLRATAGTLPCIALLLAQIPTALAQNEYNLPLLISASHQTLQGFVRIINLSQRSGTVRIYAVDDDGRRFGPATLSLNAKETRHFNSQDLRDGSPEKGLSGGVGIGRGNWRLELDTDLDLDPLAYTRPRGDGFLTSTHDVVAQVEPMRWRVPIFNPGSNMERHSWLRVVNTSGVDTEVVIEGLDDRGAPPPGGMLRFTLPAGAARMLSARALEEGASEAEFAFDGRFGNGSGKWQLFVSADHPIQVMSLLRSASGHLSNLSTSSVSPAPTPNPAEERMVLISIDGERVRLAVRIFRPGGRGPFPTLIFHHGSTGWGDNPLLFPLFYRPDPLIHYFVDRGWSVVLPSRRGRGGSEGAYDEGFKLDRTRYSGEPAYSLPGADRALADIDAITDVIRRWSFVDSDRILIGGQSRGGILSIAHAGQRPTLYRGVLNFVGGWLGGRGRNQTTVNQNIFNRGVPFGKETLWLYANDDRFYSLDTTRSYFAAFEEAGGKGVFIDDFPDEIGHSLFGVPEHWGPTVDAYLERLGLPHQPVPSALRFTPDPSLPPDAFLGHWNGWFRSVGESSGYGTVTISSVSDDGEAIGSYTYGPTRYHLQDSVADGVLRRQFGTDYREFFLASDDVMITTYRKPKTESERSRFTRVVLTRVSD